MMQKQETGMRVTKGHFPARAIGAAFVAVILTACAPTITPTPNPTSAVVPASTTAVTASATAPDNATATATALDSATVTAPVSATAPDNATATATVSAIAPAKQTAKAPANATVQNTATPAVVPGTPTVMPTKGAVLNSPLSSANIPLNTIFGIEMSPIQPGATLAQLQAANVRWIRRTAIPWRLVEPVEGQRNWTAISGLEQEFKTAAEQGLKVVVVVREAPVWAQAVQGAACGPVKADKFKAFGAFMRDLVARYSPAPYNLHYWEIWNEPDIAPQLVPSDSLWGCWGDSDDEFYGGGAYGEMLKVVYPLVKSARPDALVMVGGLLLDCDPRNPPAGKDCKPARFLEGILKVGGGDAFDGVAFHAYDYYDSPKRGVYSHSGWNSSSATTGPVIAAKAAFVREVLTKYNKPDKFLMNTEMALVCGRDGTEARCVAPEYADTKAAYVVEAYAASFAQGLRAGVWYSLPGWRGSGLIDANGKGTIAYQAYAFAASKFGGATSIKPLSLDKGMQGYELGKADGRMWVIWSADGNGHTLTLPDMPRAAFDLTGKPIQPDKTVTVSSMPMYIEW
jgi:hypothetical protein